jgi:zinc transport system ATP-binding protein
LSVKFVDAVIDVKDLCFKSALQNVSFTIKRGEYVAIIGPNGGGKSTLVKLLLGLLEPTSGEINLFSKPQKKFHAYHKIGYVPQKASHIDSNFPVLVKEVIKMGLAFKSSIFKKESRQDLELLEKIMQKLEIWDLRDRRVSTLSGGQMQRVMIARALVSKPQILILDEPNTGVDSQSQRRFYEMLKELNLEENITILFVTHDLGVIADDVGSVLCINQVLLACHNPHEILGCSQMSKLYGIDAHVVCHHH